MRQTLILYLFLAAALLGYLLPWVVAPSAPMTLNAYDLSEWASLHPLQRQTIPALLAPLELRLQLVILSVALGLLAGGRTRRWLSFILILLLALAQLPPFEFLYDIRNTNYSQQFTLALVSLVTGAAATPFKLRLLRPYVLIVISILGIGSALHGAAQALDLFALLDQGASAGAGLWINCLSYSGIIVIAIASLLRDRRPRSSPLHRTRPG